jgi:hypothetical protein
VIDPAYPDSDEAWREMARLLSCVYQKDTIGTPLMSKKKGKNYLELERQRQ